MSERLKVINNESSQPWYSEGLPFECTGCGQCCTGAPGYIWVNEEEITTIADHLDLSIPEFTARFLRRVNGQYSLVELAKTYDCVFLKDNKCQIYPIRPTQCRTFPWWPRNLRSKEDWEEAAKYCEGINKKAPIVPLDVIEEQRAIHEASS